MKKTSKSSRNRAREIARDEVLIPISIRLPAALVAEYEQGAVAIQTSRSALMRRVLERKLGRLPVPPVVPAVNREAWMEMRRSAADLHALARALDARRTPALDQAVMQAAARSAELIDWLRNGVDHPPDVADALAAALEDARRLNEALHAQMTARVEELDLALVERTHAAVLTATRVASELSHLLLGHVILPEDEA